MSFSTRPLKYPAPTLLVVLWQEAISFLITDFIRLPDGLTSYTALLDYGDGTTETVTWTTGDPPAAGTHTYTAVGCVMLRIDIQFGSTEVREKLAWPMQIGCQAADFSPWPSLSIVPAVLSSVELPVGKRHLFMPLPALGSSGPPPTPPTPPTGEEFMRGIEVMLRQFQQAYANGFGRIPPPDEDQIRAVNLYLMGDVISYGTSTTLKADLGEIEQKLTDALRDGGKPDALAAVKQAYDALFDDITDLTSLTRVNLTGGSILIPGARSLWLWEVLEWRAFQNSGVDETTPLGDLALQDWRKYRSEYDRDPPNVDWGNAYFWTLAQAVFQAVTAMYLRWDIDDSPEVRVVVQCAPGSGAVSLRVWDNDLKFWVQVTLSPSGADGHLSLSDMVDDGHAVALPGAGHVAGRVVGLLNITGTDVPHAFDLVNVETALQGDLFAQTPSINTGGFTSGGLNVYREVVGNESSKTQGPDGTSYVASITDDLAVVTIGVPALALPDGKDHWSALEPLAAYRLASLQPGRKIRALIEQMVAQRGQGEST